jgi:hypothetical protein
MRPSTYPSPYGLDKGTEAPMVVTLMVHVHPDVSDRDVLEVTKMVWGKVNGAVKSGGGGEVSVGVKRGWEGLDT